MQQEVFVLPASFAQERLWFVDQWGTGGSLYNLPAAFRLRGRLDVGVLQRSLSAIVERHEVLRTTFAAVDGQPYQVIALEASVPLPVEDLGAVAMKEREERALQLAGEEARKPFDLAEGPLLRARVWRLGEDEHILCITMHHIVSDGWSMGVFFRELSELYGAMVRGRQAVLPELAIQYGDYAVWQREWLQGEVLERELGYWKEQLRGLGRGLELPTDHARPAVQAFRGGMEDVTLSVELSRGLQALSLRGGATLFMTLLAALKVLLYRYSGQTDVVVGTAIANRNREEIEGLIGFFVNMLVLRTDLRGDPTFMELLSREREVCLGAYEHQDMPFERLVAELQPERDLSRNPLFQVGFAMQNAPREELQLEGLGVGRLRLGWAGVRSDVELFQWQEGERLAGVLVYNGALFEAATVRRMAGHYERLLEGIVAHPDQRIGLLPMLSESERRQLLVEWNETEGEYPAGEGIQQLFEGQVARTPGAVAVECGEQRVSYEELNGRANQLARYLRKRGVGPEVLVGICLQRSVELIVGILGILKAGGAYVPLDPGYPEERLALMSEDAGMALWVTESELVGAVPERGVEAVCLDREGEAIGREGRENLGSGVRPENLAYVIYTSGSTGRPNGVMVSHRGLHNVIASHLRGFPPQPGWRMLHVYSFSFDAASGHLFIVLCSGWTLCLAGEEWLESSTSFARILRERAITHVASVPSMLMSMVPEGLPDLQMVNTGGEVCPAEVVARWGVGRRLVVSYGPTETTFRSTSAECKDASARPSIGRPIANTQIYILDDELQPVPIGVTGELYIGGVGLARGYLKRPGLTAWKFVPNPFSEEVGARMYRTGDLARYLADGNIDFVGRVDEQVKVRGLRIEVGEIEAVLAEHAGVNQAVVVVREEEGVGPHLVGYVVAQEGQGVEVGELRSYLRGKLPGYMMPAAFVVLEALPRTPSGKLDRRSLPAPERSAPDTTTSASPPSTPWELAIAEIWGEVLGVAPVSVYDNFFDLGGHSLLAMQVVARVEKRLGVRIGPAELVMQTLGQLAAQCEAQGQLLPRQQPAGLLERLRGGISRALGA